MAKNKIEFTYAVRLAGRKGSVGSIIFVRGRSMYVNPRGDLLICKNANPTNYSLDVLACFRTGSWLSAIDSTENGGVTDGEESGE